MQNGAPFRQKLGTFMATIFNFCTTSKYFSRDTKLFNQFNIYLNATGTIFCKYVSLFCATFSVNMNLLLSVIIFFVATAYFFVAHIILVRNVNFYVKCFSFVDTSFLATQHIFVLPKGKDTL